LAAAGSKEGNGRTGPDSDRRGISLLDGGRLPDESRIAEAVRVALLQPGDIDSVNRNGDTALHAAAALGYDRVVQMLADKGAKLSVKNGRGLTPLSQPNSPPRTVELLRKLGAVE
jgi:hypothetical protein